MILVRLLLLVALLKGLVEIEQPFLCSGIYTVAIVVSSFFMGIPLDQLAIITALVFVLSSAYFWVLNWINMGSLLWWLVMVPGLLLCLLGERLWK